MNILLISPYWKEPHRWMVSSFKLAELWRRMGYEVIAACMGSRSETFTPSPGITVHAREDFFLRDPWNYGIAPGFSGFVGRLAAREKPAIIVINKLLFWSTFSLIGLKLRGLRTILTTDALVGMTWQPRGRLPKILAAIYAWTFGWLLLKLADRVVFFHPQPEKLLKRLGIAQKSRVIPTGIDPTPYTAGYELRVTSYAQLATRNSVTVTYIGRLESVKGVDDFLAAAHPLRAQFPQLTIRVVGWHAAHHPLVERYGNDVEFTGLRDDIPAVLAETDIFVLPSHSEGLSNALMEAMSSGCACVASDVGGNAFLLQNGVSGLLFPAGDREALKAHLRRLLEDPAKRSDLGLKARARILEHFSWDIVANQYQALFEEHVRET